MFIWTTCSPSLEDLGKANVDVQLGVDSLPLLERGSSQMTGFGKEDCDYLIGSASRYLEFHSWVLTGEKTDLRLLLDFWVILVVYKSLVTRDDLPPSKFRRM